MSLATKRENNFDALRLVFAIFVIFSHAYALVGKTEPVLLGRTLGNLGVHGFFVISGYLIVKSKLNSSSSFYVISRALRILPGLVVALYIANLIGNLAHHFEHNPVPQITDGPVWTLPWEAICYLLVLVFGIIGGLVKSSYPAVLIALWSYFIVGSITGNVDPFFLAILPMILVFFSGGLLQIANFKPSLLTFIPALIGIFLTFKYSIFLIFYNHIYQYFPLWNSPQYWKGPWVPAIFIHTTIYFLCFPLLVISAGLFSQLKIKLSHDISYGVYIYAWPVSQTLIFFGEKHSYKWNPLALAISTLVIVIPIAYLSCRLIEEPFMRLKDSATFRKLK